MELSMHKIHHNLEGIKDIKFYHVKIRNNKIANDKDNMVCVFGQGVLIKNGDPYKVVDPIVLISQNNNQRHYVLSRQNFA